MPTILFSAPYMIPFLDRFRPVLARYGLDLITPPVRERLEEEEILKYAGQFDGAICGDDRYTRRVLEACAPRLKVISKWGTGIDSMTAPRPPNWASGCAARPMLSPYRLPTPSWVTCWPLPAASPGWIAK